MLSELKKFFCGIRENTGICVSVVEADAAQIAAFEGVVQEEANDRTLFKAVYKTTPLLFAIEGTGPVQRNYAFLLADMIENSVGRAVNLPKGEYLRRILAGECSAADVRRYAVRYSVPEIPCFALAINAEGRAADIVALLSQYADGESDCAVGFSPREYGFIKFMGPDSEYQSATDFADFLARSLLEELGVRAEIGVGGTFARFDEIGESYRQACAALRMSGMFNTKGAVHSYREFLLVRMFEDLPESKLAEYMNVLLDEQGREFLKDEDMRGTAEEFLENSLNVSETSRNLYMHRNTLMYRLDKIERVLGLVLRKFGDAVTFRIITILNKLV